MIDAAPSGLRRAWVSIGWVGVVTVVALSLMPSPPQLLPVDQADKAEHILAFGGLMFWFAQVYLSRRGRLAAAALLLALGVGIEFAQGQTGYRSFEYADMIADGAGIFVGWLLAPPRLPSLYAWSGRFVLALSQR